MLIQVDVDSTLYDADKLFGQVAEEAGIKWPYNARSWLPANSLRTFDGEEVTVEALKRVFRRAHSREYVLQQTPYKGAAEVLGNLVEEFDEIEIAYVSDRNEQQSKALEDWLEANDFLHSPDQKVVVSKDKRHWMRQHRPEIVIDDRVRTLIMARFELGAYGATLEHAHNINLRGEVEGIFVCKNWREIDSAIREGIFPRIGTKTMVRV